ncbi:hypothetical protein OOJ91_13870 [Micromonospora lupini]|uniref:hypothetical protein n=1 Tax=Micromonospora lupini TaxID=285679 RepID=UPI002252D6AD|nr:hypothetical protein [Micromonospora lupini]MCX5066935.1 hypothetical protein [Micromonospora lupini]
MTVSELQARVDRGVTWLDEHHGGWWRVDLLDRGEDGGPIDLDALSMSHNCYCVLGQLLGSYFRAEIALDESVRCGFDTATFSNADLGRMNRDDEYRAECETGRDDEFTALTALWTQVIERRRAAAGQARNRSRL